MTRNKSSMLSLDVRGCKIENCFYFSMDNKLVLIIYVHILNLQMILIFCNELQRVLQENTTFMHGNIILK